MRILIPILFILLPLFGAVYHVDPERGKAGASGLTPEDALPTVKEVLAKCRGAEADEIRVAPGVLPLREEVVLAGKVYSPEKPLVLDFGSRWITATEPIPAEAWRPEGAGLWRAEGLLKTVPFSFLVINGRAERMGRGRIFSTKPLPARTALAPWQWTIEGDDLLLCLPNGRDIAQVGVERAHRATGISLMGGSRNANIWIRNARVKFATNDGINLHGPREGALTEGIRFSEVRSDWNWDQGISSHDGCQSVVEDAVMIGNVAGLVHIDTTKTVHRRLLLAEGGRFDLFFYGQCQAVFEDCYVYSAGAERHLFYKEKELRPDALFAFSNSVFHLGASNAMPWVFALGGIPFRLEQSTFWLDQPRAVRAETCDVETRGLIRHCIFRSALGGTAMAWGPRASVRLERTLFDKVGVRLGTNTYQDGPALRASGFADAQTGFCKRLEASPFPGAARLEGLGAQLSPAMQERVRQYQTRELLGGGFALVSKTRGPSTLTLVFNRPVDPLSLKGGLLQTREGRPVAIRVAQSPRGDSLELRDLGPADKVLLTTELRSDLGPDGLAGEVAL
ncbi:MAG: hypothetical protein J0L75_10775 [Spirochaetes bacterium]|nr:hypothetical protein [Spirochaetota bacterium]